MNPAWLVPTVRAVPWQPLAGVAACVAVVTVVAAWADTWPVGVLGLLAAALAAGVVAGLRDPAAALLAAVPTSAARRRARRLVLLVPLGLGVWLASVVAARHWEPGLGWPIGTVAALTATGLAVATWAPEPVALQAGVAAPVLWYAVGWGGGLHGSAAEVLLAWQHHPWLVTGVATTALLLGRNR